jgi:hypothetical protein
VERLRGEMLHKEKTQGTMGNEEEPLPKYAVETTSPSYNSDHHCMRGLEPFRNSIAHQDMHSKRKLHKSTIIVEQCRQAMLGINDPDRFRFLVAPQSNLALHRAQHQAAMDEEDAYPQRRHYHRQSRRFTMSALPSAAAVLASTLSDNQELREMIPSSNCVDRGKAPSPIKMSNMLRLGRSNSLNLAKVSSIGTNFGTASLTDPSWSNKSSLFSADIRRMQERNAQRLMEIYKQPDGGMFWYTNGSGRVFRSRLLDTVGDDKIQVPNHPCDNTKPPLTSSNEPKLGTKKLSSRKRGHNDKVLPGVSTAKIDLLLILALSLVWSVNAFTSQRPSMPHTNVGSKSKMAVQFTKDKTETIILRALLSDQMGGIDFVNRTGATSVFGEDTPKDQSDVTLHQQQGHEYSFYDEATIHVRAGSGGQGSSTYKKGVGNQNGPPDGGNGGKGGDVFLMVDNSLNTLTVLNPTSWRPNSFGGSGAARSAGMSSSSLNPMYKSFRAENGSDGARQLKDGRFGKDVLVRDPPAHWYKKFTM